MAEAHEVKELQKLEEAAEGLSEPQQIQKQASEAPTAAQVKPSHASVIPYLIAVAVFGLASFLVDWNRSLFRPSTAEKLHRYLTGGLTIAIIVAMARALEIYGISRIRNAVSRFNLKRILRLIVVLVLVFVTVSVLFVNWYAAVVSLGLISLILGFALQSLSQVLSAGSIFWFEPLIASATGSK